MRSGRRVRIDWKRVGGMDIKEMGIVTDRQFVLLQRSTVFSKRHLKMLLLLFILSVSSEPCRSQYAYEGLLPYAVRRPPPVRRSAIEALERLRLPVARYFPQVDTQEAAPAPYPGIIPSAALSGYRLSPGNLYALPPQWTDDFVQQMAPEDEENDEYGNYEYEAFNPVYREPYEMQEAAVDGGNLYNDLMTSYLMGAPEEIYMQRRNDQSGRGVVPISNVLETNATETTPSPAIPSQQPQVQVTAVPASPEKKNVKSLVVPDPVPQEDSWRDMGQKEEPLFRPLQTSQRTTWNSRNTQSPIPLLKQMIQGGQKSVDPLMEELSSLKKP